jgi:hypothetical protein
MEEVLLKVGKYPAFRKDWEGDVWRKHVRQMFTRKEVLEDMKLYTGWRPEIMSMYHLIAAYVFDSGNPEFSLTPDPRAAPIAPAAARDPREF